jgi:hypothetical protein
MADIACACCPKNCTHVRCQAVRLLAAFRPVITVAVGFLRVTLDQFFAQVPDLQLEDWSQ